MKYVFKNPIYKIAIQVLDLLGGAVFFPIKLFNKQPVSPKSILVSRLDHIGDFVCTTPLFKNIKKNFPEAKITVLVNSGSKDMAHRDPNIDKVITFSPFYLARNEKASPFKGLMRVIKDVRRIGFDLGIEPRGDLISIIIMWLGGVKYRAGYGITGGGFLLHKECRYDRDIHAIDRNMVLLEEMDIPSADRSLELYFNDEDTEVVEGLLKGVKREGMIVLHPFAGARAKEWPLNRFQKLVNRLKDSGREILLAGSKNDRGVFENVIDVRGKISLPQLAYLIKSAGLFIGLDSGPANMAAALNIPSVVICSGTNIPQLWIPDNRNVRLVYKDTECKPCESKVCKKDNHECMDRISVDEVMEAVKGLGL